MGDGIRTAPEDGPAAPATRASRAGDAVTMGPLDPSDHDALSVLFAQVVAAKEGFPHAPPLTPEDFDTTWVTSVTLTVAARVETVGGPELVGAYYLRPNFVGRGAHVANAGYVVAARWRRHGIGRLLVEDSIERAPALGFDAIQFNLVFESNPARSLYERLGWRQIGRVPEAVDGEDALVYWRRVG